MKRILKFFFISLGLLVLTVLLIGWAFIQFSPQFGGESTAEQRSLYASTGHWADGVFTNPEPIHMEMDCHSIEQMINESFCEPDPHMQPVDDVPVRKLGSQDLTGLADSSLRITWFGHSTYLVEIQGKRILFDPVFGQYAAPHPWLGRKRYNSEMPIDIKDLPPIDAVIISHDHYDHLDYGSVVELAAKANRFLVPLGVDNHLRAWDVAEAKIQALDWWEETTLGHLLVALTPSRHMSGRGLSDQSATLWGSWVLLGDQKRLYFSGDGGYGKHFKEIGKKYGPFDVGLMECGQYNKLWADVHMMPEQTVQAAQDIRASFMVPIHWGCFTLATHSWTDPAERVTTEAQRVGMPIGTPRIGESILVEGVLPKFTSWWEEVE